MRWRGVEEGDEDDMVVVVEWWWRRETSFKIEIDVV
jgi:hypothetical protein